MKQQFAELMTKARTEMAKTAKKPTEADKLRAKIKSIQADIDKMPKTDSYKKMRREAIAEIGRLAAKLRKMRSLDKATVFQIQRMAKSLKTKPAFVKK